MFSTSAAHADTLWQAFRQAYQTNPSLTGARAGLRATDEGVALAKANGRPSLTTTAGYQEFAVRSTTSFISPPRAVTAGANFTIPIYQGGAVRNAVRAADARVDAGRAGLRSTEANVFTAVVASYLDVIRDQAIAELNAGNVRALETNLEASRDRFQVGDLTRTDVAQSQARLATAQSQLQTALAQLDVSKQNYLRDIGVFPTDLRAPAPLAGLPATPDDAVDLAIVNSPQLIAAKAQSNASNYDIRVAAASRLPRLSVVTSSNYNNYLGSLGSSVPGFSIQQSQQTATLGLSATVPLYQGGAPTARVRQTQALFSQSLEQIVLIERSVVATTRSAFSRHVAAQAVIQSAEVAVKANELALEGVQAENSVGTRSVLEVLNAEQELLNSRTLLVTARRDAYVASFSLLAAIGRAEARELGLFDTIYDPTIDLHDTKPRSGGQSGSGNNIATPTAAVSD